MKDDGVRVGVVARGREATQALGTKGLRGSGGYMDPGADSWKRTDYTITGYACACPDTTAPTVPAVVLDPFGGTGTTALVAKALGRTGISVDLSGDYCRLAEWRTNDPDQLAAAMQVDKPPRETEGQLGFDLGLDDLPVRVDEVRVARTCPACGFRNNLSNRRNCEKCGADKAPAEEGAA